MWIFAALFCPVTSIVLLLFFRKRGGELERCVDEFLTKRVIAVSLGSGADPARHAAAAHDSGGDAGDLIGPGFVVLATSRSRLPRRAPMSRLPWSRYAYPPNMGFSERPRVFPRLDFTSSSRPGSRGMVGVLGEVISGV